MTDTPERISRERLREALAEAKRGEGALAVLYTEVANDVRERVGDGSRSAVAMQHDIDAAFGKSLFRRVRAISDVVRNGAELGPKSADRALLEALGDVPPTDFSAPPQPPGSGPAFVPDERAVQRFLWSHNNPAAMQEFGVKSGYSIDLIPIDKIVVRETWSAAKLASAEQAIRERVPMPAIRLSGIGEQGLLEIEDGIHRVNAARSQGATHVWGHVPWEDRLNRRAIRDPLSGAQIRSSRKALTEAADRIAGRVTVDGVKLSKRIRRWDRELSGELARTIQTGTRQREGILQVARRIEAIDTTSEALPRYLARIEDLARSGDAENLRKVAKNYLRRAAKTLGERQVGGTLRASSYSLRSPTQRFLRDVQKAGAADIDAVVMHYAKDKALYRARVIARHETVEAYRRSYLNQLADKPGVHGVKWVLSTRHPVEDECDIFAHQNAYGLGPGVYPVDQVPERHTSCLCTLTAYIDDRHFERPKAEAGVPPNMRDSASPDAVGWMIDNSGKARKILGPTRWAAFKSGAQVLDPVGRPLRVAEVLARAKQAAE